MACNVGDRVRDNRSTWPRYNQTGTVVSVNGNNVTWRSDVDNKLVTDPMTDMEIIMSNRRKTGKRYNRGGLAIGPTHEEGGIAGIVGGQTPIEFEGGEYIMNAQTVKALGVDFMDKINSTATSYHSGGFAQGELTSLGSKYESGGFVNRRNNMRSNRRRFSRNRSRNPYARGGSVRRPNRRSRKVNNRSFRSGGNVGRSTAGANRRNRRPANQRRYNTGGRVSGRRNVARRSTRRYNMGGQVSYTRNQSVHTGTNNVRHSSGINIPRASGKAVTSRDITNNTNRLAHTSIQRNRTHIVIDGRSYKIKG